MVCEWFNRKHSYFAITFSKTTIYRVFGQRIGDGPVESLITRMKHRQACSPHMLYRFRYRHLPIDQIARSYWSDDRATLALAERLERAGEPEVMIEDDEGREWTTVEFRAWLDAGE